MCEQDFGEVGFGGVDLPFERTARHSSGVLSSGYAIFWDEEELEPKKLPRKGIVGMDLKACLC